MKRQTPQEYVHSLGQVARKAAAVVALSSGKLRNDALLAAAVGIREARAELQAANKKDVAAGEGAGLAGAMIDRLRLTDAGIEAMSAGLEQVAGQPDPVGMTICEWDRPNGLHIEKRRVPIGVIGIIFESRPNVTADAAGLCLKAGNACILRGGKEARNSNLAIAGVLQRTIASAGLPGEAVTVIDRTDRAVVRAMARAEGLIDVIIPRGGEQLIRAVTEAATIPVIKHYAGNCHVYVDAAADLDMAEAICMNAKCQRPGVCNAMETLLVDAAVAEEFLPRISAKLMAAGVELRGCQRSRRIVGEMVAATEDDWTREYLDLILAVRVVDSLEDAIEHINKYSSAHTEAIVTDNPAAAERFAAAVDSSSVMVNASTRFADGGEYGLGAEVGISTDKLHARGPMGAEDLTTYKWIVTGSGQVRR